MGKMHVGWGRWTEKRGGQALVLALSPASKNADGADGGNAFRHARLIGSSLQGENYVMSQLGRSSLASPAWLLDQRGGGTWKPCCRPRALARGVSSLSF